MNPNRLNLAALVFGIALVVGISVGVRVAGGADTRPDGPAKPLDNSQPPAVGELVDPARKWQNLLPQIDPDKHIVGKGIWRLTNGKLTGYPAGHGARLRVPVVPTGNYELRARWEPRSGDSAVAIIVPHGDRMASVEVLTGRNYAGLGDLNGVRPDVNETRTDVRIKPGKVYDVAVRVTVDGNTAHIVAKLDAHTIVDWKGRRSELEHEFFAPPKPASLGLAVSGDASTFHRLELRNLTGTAEPWQPAAAPAKDQ